MKKVLPKNKKIFIALDISGEDETYLYGDLLEVSRKIVKINKKLNFVIIV